MRSNIPPRPRFRDAKAAARLIENVRRRNFALTPASGIALVDIAKFGFTMAVVTPLLVTGHIPFLLLLAGLFFPRLSLALAALVFGGYPPNPLSVPANFFLWLLVPRFLMAYYIYIDMGPNNLWFWAYIATGIMGLIGEPTYVRRRAIRRRTTVMRDGATTTTVEEIEP